MSTLSSLFGGGSGTGPISGATLLETAHTRRGWYEYRPGGTIAPGRYAVKCSHNGKGVLRVSAPGVGIESKNGTETVINVTQPVEAIQMTFENGETNPTVIRRDLPRFFPGDIWSSAHGDRSFGDMIASNEDGSVWVMIRGRQREIVRSIDRGKTWRTVGRPDHLVGIQTSEFNCQSIVRYNGLFIVAGGWDSGITTEDAPSLISSDGLSWEAVDRTVLTDVSVADASPFAYVAGRMGPVTNNIVFSGDGRTFTQLASGLLGNIIYVHWDAAGSQFIIADDQSRIATSLDGVAWVLFNTPVSFRSIVRYNGIYYGISTTGVLYSAPVVNTTTVPSWTLIANLSGSGRHRLFVWNDYLWHWDGANSRIRRNLVQNGAVNGTDWFNATSVFSVNAVPSILRNATGPLNSNSDLVAFLQDTSQWFHTNDPTGTLWTNVRPTIGASYLRDAIFDTPNSRFMVASDNGNIYTSSDLYNWTSVHGMGAVFKIVVANNIYMASTNGNQVATSPNGTTWTNRTPGLSNASGIAYGTDGTTNRWIAVGPSNTTNYARSDDNGVTWTQPGAPSGSWAAAPRDIAWGPVTGVPGGAFVVVGDSGIMWRSTDLGATWTRIDNQNPPRFTEFRFGARNRTRNWTKIKYLNGFFVATGSNIVAWSVNGLDWTYMDQDRWFNLSGQMQNVFYDSLRGRWVITGNNTYAIATTSLTDPRWKRINIPFADDRTLGAFASGTISGTNLWFMGSDGGRYTDSRNGDDWWYRDWDWSAGGTTWSGGYGWLPGENSPTTHFGYGRGVDGYGYLVQNSGIVYRTTDYRTFSAPYRAQAMCSGGNQVLESVVYGNGVWVGRNSSNESIWFSSNGWDWEVVRGTGWTTNVRLHNIMFADGFFWGIWTNADVSPRSNAYAKLWRSADGFNWETVYHWRSNAADTFNAYPPRWIRKTGNYYVAFGHRRDNSNDSRFFWFSPDAATNPLNWTRGDVGNTANDVRITDVAVADWGVVYAYEQNASYFAPSLVGRNEAVTGLTAGAFLLSGTGVSESQFGAWNAWTLGNKIYVSNGNDVFEVMYSLRDRVSTSTTSYHWVSAYRISNWGNNGVHVPNYGVGYITGAGSNAFEMQAYTDCTFSIWNSTAKIVDFDRIVT